MLTTKPRPPWIQRRLLTLLAAIIEANRENNSIVFVVVWRLFLEDKRSHRVAALMVMEDGIAGKCRLFKRVSSVCRAMSGDAEGAMRFRKRSSKLMAGYLREINRLTWLFGGTVSAVGVFTGSGTLSRKACA